MIIILRGNNAYKRGSNDQQYGTRFSGNLRPTSSDEAVFFIFERRWMKKEKGQPLPLTRPLKMISHRKRFATVGHLRLSLGLHSHMLSDFFRCI